MTLPSSSNIRYATSFGAALLIALSGCSPQQGAVPAGPAPSAAMSLANSPALQYPASAKAPSPDLRIGLSSGYQDAGEAIWNMQLVSHVPPS
ncbi:MAG TPA: hypothetical protein VF035_04190, partial [Longimicrobiales bacterium]